MLEEQKIICLNFEINSTSMVQILLKKIIRIACDKYVKRKYTRNGRLFLFFC